MTHNGGKAAFSFVNCHLQNVVSPKRRLMLNSANSGLVSVTGSTPSSAFPQNVFPPWRFRVAAWTKHPRALCLRRSFITSCIPPSNAEELAV